MMVTIPGNNNAEKQEPAWRQTPPPPVTGGTGGCRYDILTVPPVKTKPAPRLLSVFGEW